MHVIWQQHKIGVVQLDIYKCHLADSGVYKVVARNYCGEVSDEASLEVTQSHFESSTVYSHHERYGFVYKDCNTKKISL